MKKKWWIAITLLIVGLVMSFGFGCDGYVYETEKYTVTFMNGEETVSSKEYGLGETVEFPEDPVRMPDEEYEYSFLGWTMEEDSKEYITAHIVEADVTFYAAYSKTALSTGDKKVYIVTFRDSQTGLPILVDGEPYQKIEEGGTPKYPEAPDHTDTYWTFSDWSEPIGSIITARTEIVALYERTIFPIYAFYLDDKVKEIGQARYGEVYKLNDTGVAGIDPAFAFENWYWSKDDTTAITSFTVTDGSEVASGISTLSEREVDGQLRKGVFVYAKYGLSVGGEHPQLRLGGTLTYGGNGYAYIPNLTYPEGLVYTYEWNVQFNGQTYDFGGDAHNENRFDLKNAGVYTVECVLTASYGNGLLTTSKTYRWFGNNAEGVVANIEVSKASLTLSAAIGQDSLVYGQGTPENSVTGTGFQYGESADVLDLTYEYTNTTLGKVLGTEYPVDKPPVGDYEVRVIVADPANYNITNRDENGYLTAEGAQIVNRFNVTKKQLTISLTVPDMGYGEAFLPAPAFEGFEYEEGAEVLGAPTYTVGETVYSGQHLPAGDNQTATLRYNEYESYAVQNYRIVYAGDGKDTFNIALRNYKIELVVHDNITYGEIPEDGYYHFRLVNVLDEDAEDFDVNYRLLRDKYTFTDDKTYFAVAEYTVSANVSKSNANYALEEEIQTVTFNVIPRDLTVTVNVEDFIYGESPAPSLAFEGFAEGEGEEVLNIPKEAGNLYLYKKDGQTHTGRYSVGDYTVCARYISQVRKSSNDNYTLIYPETAFSVAKKEVKAKPQLALTELTYGQAPQGSRNSAYYNGIQFTGFAYNQTANNVFSTAKITYRTAEGKPMSADDVFHVGSYIASVEGEADNYYLTVEEQTFTVAPKKLTVSFDVADIIYGQTPKYTLVITGMVYGDDVSLLGKETVTYDGATNSKGYYVAGTHTAAVSGLGHVDYALDPISCQFEVARKAISLTVSVDDFTYGDSYRQPTPVTEDLVEGDTLADLTELTYTISGKKFATDYQTEQGLFHADVYKLTISGFADAANYEVQVNGKAASEITADFTVSPKTITPVFSVADITYGEQPVPQLSFADMVPGDDMSLLGKAQYRYDGSMSKAGFYEVGEHKATVSGLGHNDYTFGAIQASFQVQKKGLTVTVTLNEDSIVYGAQPGYTLSYDAFVGDEQAELTKAVRVVYGEAQSDGVGLFVGSYQTKVLGLESLTNYAVDYQNATLNVTRAALKDVTDPAAQSGTYGDNFNWQGFSATGVNGDVITITYSYKVEGYTDTGSVLSGIREAGKYTVTYDIAVTHGSQDARSNYTLNGVDLENVADGRTFTITIAKATVELPAEVASKVYNGEKQTADVSGAAHYTVEKNEGGEDAGTYDVIFKLTDARNYKWNTSGAESAEFKRTFEITKKSFTIRRTESRTLGRTWEFTPVIEEPFTFVGTLVLFNQQEGQYTNNGNALASDRFKWKEGSYRITKGDKDVTNNFTLTFALNITITNFQLDIGISGNEFTYDGTAHKVQFTVTGEKEKQYAESDFKVEFADDVDGEYVDAYSFTNVKDSKNIFYRLTITNEESQEFDPFLGEFEVKISPKPLARPTQDEKSFTYNTSPQTFAPKGFDEATMSASDVEQTTAGHHNVTISLKDKENYIWASGGTEDFTLDFYIAKQAVELPTLASKQYNAAMQTADDPKNALYTVKTNNGGKDVGKYDVVFTLKDSSNYRWSNDTDEGNKTDYTAKFEITQAPLTVKNPYAGGLSHSYTGGNQWQGIETSSNITGLQGKDTAAFKYGNSGVANATSLSFINAATYTVTFAVELKNGAEDVAKNYKITYQDGTTYTVEITKADITWTIATSEHTYNAELQGYTEEEIKADIQRQLKKTLASATDALTVALFETSAWQFTDANEYTVKFKVTGANFVEKAVTYTVKIAKAEYNVTKSEENTFTYNGDAQGNGITFTGVGTENNKEPAGASVKYSHESKSGNTMSALGLINAAEYTVTYTIKGNNNYIDKTDTFTVTINRAEAVISIAGEGDRTYTYTGGEQTVEKGATLNHSETTLSYSDNKFTTVAEGKALQVKVAAAQTHNYNAAEATFTIIVNKAKSVITTDAIEKTFPYDGNSHTINAVLNHSEKSLSYTKQTFKDVADSGEVTISVDESDNYTSAQTTIMITITPKAVTVTLPNFKANNENRNLTYDGKEFHLSLDVPEGVFEADKADFFTYTTGREYITVTNASEDGYQIYVSVTNPNYAVTFGDGFAEADGQYYYTVKIEQASNSLTGIVEKSGEFGYNGREQYTLNSDNVKATFGTPTITVYYNSTKQETCEFKNAGKYEISITVDGNTNYTGINKTITFTITPAKLTVNKIKESDTYTGSEFELSAFFTVSGGQNGETGYSSKITSESYKYTTIQGADNYTVTLTATSNYTFEGGSTTEGGNTTTVTITVNKANAKITVANAAPSGATYDGTSKYTLEATTNFGEIQYAYTFRGNSVGSTDFINAGEYVITLTVADNDNWNGTSETVTFKIAQVKFSDTLPDTGLPTSIVRKPGLNLAALTLKNGWAWREGTDTTTDLTKESYELTIVYTDPSGNYLPEEKTVKIETEKTKLTFSFSQSGIVEKDFKAEATSINDYISIADLGSVFGLANRDDSISEQELNYLKGKLGKAGVYLELLGVSVTGAPYGSTYELAYNFTLAENDYYEYDKSDYVLDPVVLLKIKSVDVGGTLYTIEDALAKAESGKTVLVKYNTSFSLLSDDVTHYTEANRTVKKGVTLFVPCDSKNTALVSENKDITGVFNGSELYCTLIITTNLTVYGRFHVNAVRMNTSNDTARTNKSAGYSEVEVKKDAVVTLNSGSEFVCWGYIYGEGTIEALSGSTAKEPFAMSGYKGGRISSAIYQNVFPFNQYALANIMCHIKLHKGSTYLVQAAISGKVLISTKYFDQELKFIGTSDQYFVELVGNNCYMEKYVDASGYIHLDAHGDLNFHNLSIEAMDINMDTSGKQVPIPGNFRLRIAEGTTTIPNGVSMKLLFGSELSVEEGAVLNVVGSLYAYNNAHTTYSGGPAKWQDGNNKRAYPDNDTINAAYRTAPSFKYTVDTPAEIIVSGTINATGTLAGDISGTEGGVLNLAGATSGTITEDYANYNNGSTDGKTFQATLTGYLVNQDDSVQAEKQIYIYTDNAWVAQDSTRTYNIEYHFVFGDSVNDENAVTNTNSSTYTIKDVITLEDAEFEGWLFMGWYSKQSCSEDSRIYFIEGTRREDITIYGLFKQVNSYVFEYHTNDSSIEIAADSVLAENLDGFDPLSHNAQMTVHDNDADYNKYFDGWYMDTDCQTPFNVASVKALGEGVGVKVPLYAKWNMKAKITLTISNVTVTVGGKEYGNRSTIFFKPGVAVQLNMASVDGTSTKGSITSATPSITLDQWQCIIETDRTSGSCSFVMPNSDFTITFNGTKGKDQSLCLMPGTLITLADGTQKLIEDLVMGVDEILTFDHFTGRLTATSAYLLIYREAAEVPTVKLHFSNGTTVHIVEAHGFFDVGTNQYEIISTENVAQYVGHKFYSINGGVDKFTSEIVELISYELSTEYTECYSLFTSLYADHIANGMLAVTDDGEGLYNFFELDENMKYDEAKMQADIEKYGLFTYEEFAEYLTKEEFDMFNVQYLKVALGKGLVTMERIYHYFDVVAQYR